jgi:ketosteroid isomerase-like protein
MRIASLAVGIALLICSGTSAQNMDAALVARSAEWDAAMKAKDSAKLASFYTEDFLAFSEGVPPTRGRAAAQKDFETMFRARARQAAQTKSDPEMSTKMLDATTSGNIGYVVGTFSIPPAGPDGKARTGHYMQIWKRVGGQWLIAYATFSDHPAGPSQ